MRLSQKTHSGINLLNLKGLVNLKSVTYRFTKFLKLNKSELLRPPPKPLFFSGLKTDLYFKNHNMMLSI